MKNFHRVQMSDMHLLKEVRVLVLNDIDAIRIAEYVSKTLRSVQQGLRERNRTSTDQG